MPLISAGVGAVAGLTQTLIGAGQARKANKDLKSLFAKRKAYKTPAEVFDVLNATQQNAAQGYSDQTMNYLTGQAGAGLASGLGAATRLGADPNQLSGMIDQYYGNIFKIGAESEGVKMQKFNQYADALGRVAASKDAEWQSQENILKDQMAAAAARLQGGQTNLQSGANAIVGAAANYGTGQLYKDALKTKVLPETIDIAGVDTSAYTTTVAPALLKLADNPLDRSRIGTGLRPSILPK